MIVMMIEQSELRQWLAEASQAILNRVSERIEEPQEVVLAGMGEELWQKMGLLVVVRQPHAKGIPVHAPRHPLAHHR